VGALEAGDVWLPGEGWTVRTVPTGADRTRLVGRLALAAGTSERGVWVDCSSDGQLVLTREVAALSADPAEGSDETMGASPNRTDDDTTLADTVLDAPVVVRVEVGSVTLPAREWAALGKGDVIQTGVRVGEPVVLRVAGKAIARGELVSVDGELGVRVIEMLQAGTAA
jgi:flagellar motor switch/type III secretory pathway protein FliN